MFPKMFLQNLTFREAFIVLQQIISEKPELEAFIFQVAQRVVTDFSDEEIVGAVYKNLYSLDVEDIYNNSGKSNYGYVEPTEYANEMLVEVIEPYIDEMKKYHERKMMVEVKKYCLGIIKGLKKFSECDSEFVEWVFDDIHQIMEEIFDEYKALNPKSEDIAEIEYLLEE